MSPRKIRPQPPACQPVMHPCRWLSAALLGLVLSVSACANEASTTADGLPTAIAQPVLADFPPMPAGPLPGASVQARAAAAALNRGVNFGNMLESPQEGGWGIALDSRLIELTGRDGFTQAVRLPVRWSNHASPDAAARIDETFFRRIDEVLGQLLARGNSVVLNMHHYRQLDGDPVDPGEAEVDPSVVVVRMLSMWRQIAERYAHHGPALIFEVYNEPHGQLNEVWNALLSRAVRVIRQSNPQRVLMIGPAQWNGAHALPQLQLPADPHLILTVHHYEPFDFTHQGAEWIKPMPPAGQGCCSGLQREKMTALLDLAQREGQRLGYPVVVGEFGAYSKAPEDARVAYLRFMRKEMERRRLPWMVWELAAGYGLYDPVTQRFHQPLKDALYGP